MSFKEVITFQLGNYCNYIGAHWWNIQESYFQYDDRNPSEINHDVLFREGKTLKGQVTFTPRVILLDKSENMMNVPVLTENHVKLQTSKSKTEIISVQEKPVLEKHEFIKDLENIEKGQKIDFTHKDYNFDETVRSWSDYLRTRYHPKSICTVPNDIPTEIFHNGREVFSTVEECLIEKIRSYMEECDNLQGFQVLVDPTNGFGGLGDSVLLHLQDEYHGKTVLTVPTIAGSSLSKNPVDEVKRTINILLSYQKLTENSSLLVPIGTNSTAWKFLGPPVEFPRLIYNNTNYYHTSAILASFLDTVTLKYRLKAERYFMFDLISGLNYYNKKVCAATMSLPFPIAPDSFLLDTLENFDETAPLWNQLTPSCKITDDPIFYQRITVRGIPLTRLKNPTDNSKNSRTHSCKSVEELVHLYLSFKLTAISDVTSSELPLKTSIPYPKIFSPHVSPSGNFHESSTRLQNVDVDSCPVITGLHCCKAVGRMLDSLHRCVKTINMRRFHQFFGSHMDFDEFNECLEKLLSMGYGHASDVELR